MLRRLTSPAVDSSTDTPQASASAFQSHQVNSGDANLTTADGLVSLVGALKYPYRQRPTFLANRGTTAAIRKLKKPVTGLYLWEAALVAGAARPVIGLLDPRG